MRPTRKTRGRSIRLSLREQLLEAVRKDDIKKVQELTPQVSLSALKEADRLASKLQIARLGWYFGGQLRIRSLNSSANVNEVFKSLRRGDTEKAIDDIWKGLNPNVVDAKGYTILHWLTDPKLYKSSHFKLLLDKGADINAQDKSGDTPLHWAIHYSNISLIKQLLDNDADKTVKNNEGNTPLDDARKLNNLSVLNCFDEKIKTSKLLIKTLQPSTPEPQTTLHPQFPSNRPKKRIEFSFLAPNLFCSNANPFTDITRPYQNPFWCANRLTPTMPCAMKLPIPIERPKTFEEEFKELKWLLKQPDSKSNKSSMILD